jgi:ADP-heptose:LPS heptosyltransferase/GT2 family glycosyltransferase
MNALSGRADAAADRPAEDAATRLQIDAARVTRDGLLQVEGWAAGPAAVHRIQVFLGHAFLGLAEMNLARADVGLAFPHHPRAAWSGFRFVADVSSDDLSGKAVHVRALLQGGGAARASATLDVTVLSHPPAMPPSDIHAACEHCTQLPDGRGEDGGWAVSGWAVCRAGIGAVTLALDDGAAVSAEIGLSRPDIGNRFPRIPSARQSGFAFRGRLPAAGPAPLVLHVRIRSAKGQEHELQHRLAAEPADAHGVGRDLANRIKFFIDSPDLTAPMASRPVRSALSVQGWAIARDGIESVQVMFDGIALGPAYRGLNRPDIGAAFPDWPNARRSGFALSVAPKLLTGGEHAVHVVIRDKGGGEAETTFGVLVVADAKPVTTTILRSRVSQAEVDLNAAIVTASGGVPHFMVLLRLAGSGVAELRRAQVTLMSLREQAYEGWRAVVLPPSGAPADVADRLLDGFDDLRARIAVRTAAASGPDGSAGDADATHLLALRAGDRLGCDALMEFAEAATRPPRPDFVYADERRLDPTAGAVAADFRPDWSPDLLLSNNYLGRSWCASVDLARRAGLGEAEFCRFGSYDLVLRLTEQARAVRHVAKVLCQTTRAGDGAARERAALQGALTRRGIAGQVQPGLAPGLHRVRRAIADRPVVSIVMPTCGSRGLFRAAIESLRAHTDYAPVELVAVDNIPAAQPDDQAWLRAHADIVVPMPEAFNWSRFNNAGARAGSGAVLLFLNDDVELRDPGWLAAMLEQVQRPEIGAVGARLLYPDGKLQHVGVALSATGGLHSYRFMPGSYPGPFGRAVSLRNVSAVTGACLMVRRAVFEQVGGFDEAHAIINNDVDFCLRVRGAGFEVVCTPHAELVHHELASRAGLGETYDQARFRAVCGPALRRGDPYHNPNLSRFSELGAPEPEPTRMLVAGHPLLAADRVRRILALKLDHIGDFVTAFPALRRLKQRFPRARLDVLCSPASARLARLEPAIDAVLEFAVFHERSARGRRRVEAGEREALVARLGGARYDLAIDLRKHPETRPLLQATGAKLLAGFDRDRMFPWLDVAPEWEGDPRAVAKRSHVADDLLALVEAVAVACEPAPGAAAPIVPRPPQARRRICIHPGAGSPMKQWPPEYFAALVDLLAEDDDAEFVLVGGPGECRVAARVMERVTHGERVRSTVGEVALEDLPAVLRDCDLFVGNDSGPKHLAGALGIPTVGIHSGVVDPHEWGVTGPRAVAVYREMACSPCYLTKPKACPRGLACLAGLLPSDVAAVCRRLSQAKARGFVP